MWRDVIDHTHHIVSFRTLETNLPPLKVMATRAHKNTIDRAHIYFNEYSYTMASNPIYSILWLILLCILAWPVAALCAGLWVVLMVSRIYPTVYYSNICHHIVLPSSSSLISTTFTVIYSHLKHASAAPKILPKCSRNLLVGHRSAARQSKIAHRRVLLHRIRCVIFHIS